MSRLGLAPEEDQLTMAHANNTLLISVRSHDRNV